MKNKTVYCYSLRDDNFTHNDLVGEKALMLSQLSKNNVSISEGFVVSGFAFDDYIVHNEMVDFIVNQLGEIALNFRKVTSASKQIQAKILSGELPLEAQQQTAAHYDKLTKQANITVNLSQSPLNEDLDERAAVNTQYDYGDIVSLDELFNLIKQAWANLFTEDMLKYRLKIDYEGNLSQPLVVQRVGNAEISGVLYNFDIGSGSTNETTIIANLGISNERPLPPAYTLTKKAEAKADNQTSDYYLIHKVNKSIIKLIDNSQKFMWIRPHQGEKRGLVQVKISKAWSERAKVDDLLKDKLLTVLNLTEKVVNGKFEADWVYESGSFTITRINKIPDERSRLLPEINWQKTSSVIDQVEPQKATVSIPEVNKVNSTGANNLEAPATAALPLPPLAVEPTPEAQADVIVGELLNDGKELEVIDKKEAINFFAQQQPGIELSETERSAKADTVKEMLPEVKTITEVWWDKRKPASEIKVFANNIEGYGVFSFQEIAQVLAIDDITKMKELKRIQKQICEYLAIYLVAASPKPIFIQLDRDINLEAQVEILSQLRNLYGHKNFWAILPEIREAEEISHYKKILTANAFRRTNLFKVFQLVTQPIYLANLPALIDQSIDGVVVDVDRLYANLMGMEASGHPQGSNLELLLNFLVDNLIEKSQTKLFTYISTNSKALLDNILDEMLDNGINGIIYREDDLYEFKQTLTEKESQILTKNLKKIKDKLYSNSQKRRRK